jgi:hypothetical protein
VQNLVAVLTIRTHRFFGGRKRTYKGEYVNIKRGDKQEVSAEYVRKVFLIFTVPNIYYKGD